MEGKTRTRPETVEDYIYSLPGNVKIKIEAMRRTIRKAAPQAEELISYSMPAFKLEGMLVWYAAFKEHIGFYPMASAIKAFKKELSVFKGAKGSVQFPLDKPLPLKLVRKMVKYRVKENREHTIAKAVKRTNK